MNPFSAFVLYEKEKYELILQNDWNKSIWILKPPKKNTDLLLN